jgi:hypothetical protein
MDIASIDTQQNQTAAIATKTFYTPPGSGPIRISWYIVVRTAATAGLLSLTLNWHDDIAAQTFTPSTLSLLAIGNVIQGSVMFFSPANDAITYSTSLISVLGNPAYDVYMWAER